MDIFYSLEIKYNDFAIEVKDNLPKSTKVKKSLPLRKIKKDWSKTSLRILNYHLFHSLSGD